MKTNDTASSLKRTIGLSLVLAALLAAISASDALAQASGAGDFPTLKSAPNRDQLLAAIEKCKSLVQRYKGGHVVIDRIVLDGLGDPRDVAAQMPIGGGYARESVTGYSARSKVRTVWIWWVYRCDHQ